MVSHPDESTDLPISLSLLRINDRQTLDEVCGTPNRVFDGHCSVLKRERRSARSGIRIQDRRIAALRACSPNLGRGRVRDDAMLTVEVVRVPNAAPRFTRVSKFDRLLPTVRIPNLDQQNFHHEAPKVGRNLGQPRPTRHPDPLPSLDRPFRWRGFSGLRMTPPVTRRGRK